MYRLGPDIAPYNCLFQNVISYCGYLHVWQHDGNDIKKKSIAFTPTLKPQGCIYAPSPSHIVQPYSMSGIHPI